MLGVTATCFVPTNSFTTLAVCGFFLGALKSCISPIMAIHPGNQVHPAVGDEWY